jgi:hypothetical protein
MAEFSTHWSPETPVINKRRVPSDDDQCSVVPIVILDETLSLRAGAR